MIVNKIVIFVVLKIQLKKKILQKMPKILFVFVSLYDLLNNILVVQMGGETKLPLLKKVYRGSKEKEVIDKNYHELPLYGFCLCINC